MLSNYVVIFFKCKTQQLCLQTAITPAAREVCSWWRRFSGWTVFPSRCCVTSDRTVDPPVFCWCVFWRLEYQTQETVLFSRPMRSELWDKHTLFRVRPSSPWQISPFSLGRLLPEKMSNTYKHSLIPAPSKWPIKTHCLLVFVWALSSALVIFLCHPSTLCWHVFN